MTEFTLDVHPNKCQPFKAWYLFFFFWITGVLCNIKSKTKIDFKSSLIHYLDHVWLLDPVSLHTNSSVCPFSPPSSDRQPFLFNWVSKESSEVQNQSFKEVSAMFFFVFFFFILLSLLFSLLQEILVDFWFQKSWVTVVFHQAIYQFLRPVEAIWPRLRDIFTDFFSGHTVNVYLGSENSSFYFTLSFWIYFYIMCLTVKDKLCSTE